MDHLENEPTKSITEVNSNTDLSTPTEKDTEELDTKPSCTISLTSPDKLENDTNICIANTALASESSTPATAEKNDNEQSSNDNMNKLCHDIETAIALKKLVAYTISRMTSVERPDVEIRIGNRSFLCDLDRLCSCSKFMQRCQKFEKAIYLPEEQISMRGFNLAYKWILGEKQSTNIKRNRIIELYVAAKFLEMDELIKQLQRIFNSIELFYEDTAFQLYVETLQYNLNELQYLLMSRICRFFLSIVAEKEWLRLPAEEVCKWLSSAYVGVNSEMEIFMSAVRWISCCFRHRISYIENVMACVRFALLPPTFLLMLIIEPIDVPVYRVVRHPHVYKLISDALTFHTILQYPEMKYEDMTFLPHRSQLHMPQQRTLVFDARCEYHCRRPKCNMTPLTYVAFTNYLRHLQSYGSKHWRSIKLVLD